jgi:hypothetical protein
MRHLPMAACDKMPLSEICIVGAVYFFFNEDPIHGVIVASVSWIIKVGQKITCNILDEDYREVYEMWVNTTFPDICIPNYVPNEIA